MVEALIFLARVVEELRKYRDNILERIRKIAFVWGVMDLAMI